MGRRPPKKRGSKKTASKSPANPSVQKWKLAVDLTSLEMAMGHDGFFRGEPEPVVLFSAFHVATQAAAPIARSLGRELVRFAPEGRYPLTVAPPSRAVLRAPLRGSDRDRIIVLAFALEEDNGDDVTRLYTHLTDSTKLRLWDEGAPEPAPASIIELAARPLSTPPEASRMNALDESADLRDACTGDKFVGSGALILSPHRSEDRFRLRFVSHDQRNDWTAIFTVRFD